MKFIKFKEYFDNKKKMQSKPEKLSADFELQNTDKDPLEVSKHNYEKNISGNKVPLKEMPKSPEKNITKNLGYDAPKSVRTNPNPYTANAKQPSSKELEKGLGNLGDKENIVSFKELANLNNDSFIEATKNLSTKDFINSMTNEHCGCEDDVAPHVVSYYAGAGHPDPIQAIQYLVYVMDKNPHILRALVHEARRNGCFGKMCKAMKKFPEFEQYANEKDVDDSEKFHQEVEHGEKDSEDIIAKIESPDIKEEEKLEKVQMKKSKKG